MIFYDTVGVERDTAYSHMMVVGTLLDVNID